MGRGEGREGLKERDPLNKGSLTTPSLTANSSVGISQSGLTADRNTRNPHIT